MEEVSMFINISHLYLRMKINGQVATTQIAWVLSYVQRGVAEAWKDNLLDELAKEESEVETVAKLFKKIQDKFGETTEEERKVEQLRIIEQGERSYNKYVQEYKKITRGNSCEERSLIKEFKRGLSSIMPVWSLKLTKFCEFTPQEVGLR